MHTHTSINFTPRYSVIALLLKNIIDKPANPPDINPNQSWSLLHSQRSAQFNACEYIVNMNIYRYMS